MSGARKELNRYPMARQTRKTESGTSLGYEAVA
jgi:hypothetical protein